MVKKIFSIFLYWRLFLFLPLIIAQTVIPLRRGYEYTLFPYFIKSSSPLHHFLLYPFGNFDAVYYLMIAGAGYTVNAGFFPLFPFFLWIISLPFGSVVSFYPIQYILATVLVNATVLGTIWFLYKLVRLDFAKETALEVVVAFLFFPTAFFLACFYSEGLFVLLTVSSFYSARRRNWALAGITGILLTATRLVGVAILPALLWEWYCWWRNDEKKTLRNFTLTFFPLALTPIGLIAYMLFNQYKWHDALFFVHAQGAFGNNRSISSVVILPQTLFRYLNILTSVSSLQYEWWISLLELVSVLFALFFLYLAIKRKIRLSYIIFSFIAFLIPSSTGTFTGMPRYILVIFPIFIALALLKNKTLRYALYTLFFLLQMFLFTLFAKGYFIS